MTVRPTPADRLTLLRLLSLPVLWILAGLGMRVTLGIVLALAGLTDVLDGPVARRTGRSSRFGAQLDSLADLLVMGSVVLWMAWLTPSFFRANAVLLLVWVAIGLASVTATYIRFGRVGNLHLYSAKAAGFVGYLFAIWLFVVGDYSPVFWGITIGLAILASSETLLVAVTRKHADERIGSILSRPR